jgi:pilus assembly protein CpaE
MAEELEPLLAAHLVSAQFTHLRQYPSARELGSLFSQGNYFLCFLDVDSSADQALDLLKEFGQTGLHVQIIAVLSGDNSDLILRCMRAGAADFLIQPFNAEQILGAMAKLSRALPVADASGREPAKVFAIMPAKGACGATTIACNFAFQCKRLGKKVLLADLDALTGTVSFLLKIKATHSFLDALLRAHELDKDLWTSMVTSVHGVDVLLAPEMMVEGGQELRDPTPIIDYARRNYDVVVLDTNSVYGDWNLNQARLANELLLITTNELPALQAAQRALSYLDTHRIGRWKIRLIVNRYHRDVGLSRDVIGTALHNDVFEIVPSDYDAVQKAMMEGKATSTATPFGKAVMQIADRLSGKPEGNKKSSGLAGLLGLFSKPSK